MRYIVTGGAGFIGSAAIWKLNEVGITDILVVDCLGSSDKWKNLVNRRFADYMHRDDFLRRLKERGLDDDVKAVIHMGACSSTTEKDCDFLMRNNFHYSRELCMETIRKNVRFINASSAATYGDGNQGFDDDPEKISQLKPLNMYGYSKQLFDLWLMEQNMPTNTVSLKFFNVYGPNEYHKENMSSVAYKSFLKIRDTGRMALFASNHHDYADGGQMRDFIYVKDCAEIVRLLLEKTEVSGIFNVGTGKARTWNDLAISTFKAMGVEEKIDYISMPENLSRQYQNFTEARMDRLLSICPVKMHSLEEGVEDYVKNYLMANDCYL